MKIKQTLDLRIVAASLIIAVLVIASSCASAKGYTGRRGGCNATRYTIL
ncbi:hypothetical protein [Flavisolibacter tropicus]|nr:hypothetical protein [Flavisolibacter tropicus]